MGWTPPAVGQVGTWTKTFTAEDVETFAALTGTAVRCTSGPGSVFLHQKWDYPAPVYIGDTVTAEAEVLEARADKPITTVEQLHAMMRR